MIDEIIYTFTPARDDRENWEISVSYREANKPQPVVTKSPPGFDVSAFPEVKRRILTAEKDLDGDEANALQEYCLKLRIAATPTADVYGLDGETYTLTFSCGSNESSFSWWADLPTNWRELEVITDTLTRWAES